MKWALTAQFNFIAAEQISKSQCLNVCLNLLRIHINSLSLHGQRSLLHILTPGYKALLHALDLIPVQHTRLHPVHSYNRVHLVNCAFDQTKRQRLHHQNLNLLQRQLGLRRNSDKRNRAVVGATLENRLGQRHQADLLTQSSHVGLQDSLQKTNVKNEKEPFNILTWYFLASHKMHCHFLFHYHFFLTCKSPHTSWAKWGARASNFPMSPLLKAKSRLFNHSLSVPTRDSRIGCINCFQEQCWKWKRRCVSAYPSYSIQVWICRARAQCKYYQLSKVIDRVSEECRQCKIVCTAGLFLLRQIVDIHTCKVQQRVLVVFRIVCLDLLTKHIRKVHPRRPLVREIHGSKPSSSQVCNIFLSNSMLCLIPVYRNTL